MKIIALILMISTLAHAEVTLQDCQDDALTFANHTRPVAPLTECADIINAEATKVEKVTGAYRAFGKGHMIYVDKRDGAGNVLERTLVAGDQTDLVDIEKLFIDLVSRRLYVVQANGAHKELLVYDLDFLGNVTPLNLMRSMELLTNVSSVKAEGDDDIEVINTQGSWLMSAKGETRASRSKQVPLNIRAK